MHLKRNTFQRKSRLMHRKNKFSFKNMESSTISWVTAYDYPIAYCAEVAGIDMVLVGDSGAMVQHGHESTLPISMHEMLTMCKSVSRGAPNTFVVGDMPFGSYEISDEQAVQNAIAFLKEGSCDAIKLEGGARIASRVKAISKAGIIAIGHIGLTPQSASQLGGYKVQGKSIKNFEELVTDALALQEAGATAILLEAIPEACSKMIKSNLEIPLFGIGAGGGLDGQLLISNDALGLYPNFKPRFAKNFFNEAIKESIKTEEDFTAIEFFTKSLSLFNLEVKNGTFPSHEFSYPISENDLAEIKKSSYWM
jgi:3-methyl-2-oxobutanoate hydroxymethyltransferase